MKDKKDKKETKQIRKMNPEKTRRKKVDIPPYKDDFMNFLSLKTKEKNV